MTPHHIFLQTLILFCCLTASLVVSASEVVDINRASAATMIENWKGIGEVKANAIVAYRKKNGPFKSIDDLTNVKGIGEGLLKNNRKLMSTNRGISKPTGKSGTTANKSTTKKTDRKNTVAKTTDNKSTSKKSGSKKQKSTNSLSSEKKDKKSTSKKSTVKKSAKKKKTSKKKKPVT